ncbi:hypothetical protein [Streptomyces sp. NRRL WC-3742]|uniref:hypothetical protein n=1 Tax=Streptomyces sp. NRRL WC-3742 TaxID=1463934 RepID=UPI00068B9B88|nr:hypothetical protein [Streptomyces sp. NRRL WC-3742]
MTEPGDRPAQPLEWCVVANVAARTRHGEASDVETSLKHFAPGAKLWVFPPRYQGDDDRLHVVGVHRGSRTRYISMILFRRHLENFRVKGLYSPAVQRVKEGSKYWSWGRVWCCPQVAQPWIDRWNDPTSGSAPEDFPAWPVRRTHSHNETCPHGSQ